MENNVVSENGMILSAALDIGELILRSGGEVNRVEETVERICKSYGACRVDVFAIYTSIVASMERNGESSSLSRRIQTGQAPDYYRLEELNKLSRKICSECPPPETLEEQIGSSAQAGRDFIWLDILGYVLAAGGFAVFFGGDWKDGICAGVGAILIFWVEHFLKPLLKTGVVYYVLCSLFAGIFAVVFSQLGLCSNLDKVMIGEIMLVIPGFALTNSMRDLLMGDTMSGMLRFMEALLQAGAVAMGFAIAIYLKGAIGV